MQVLCPYYVKKKKKKKTHIVSNVALTDLCVVVSLNFELNESIIKQLTRHLFHTFFKTVISL